MTVNNLEILEGKIKEIITLLNKIRSENKSLKEQISVQTMREEGLTKERKKIIRDKIEGMLALVDQL